MSRINFFLFFRRNVQFRLNWTLNFIFSILFGTFELCSENWRAINLSKSKRHFIKHQEIQKSRLDLVKIGAKCMFVFMFAKCNFGYSGMWNFIFGTGNTHIIISLLSNLLRIHQLYLRMYRPYSMSKASSVTRIETELVDHLAS